MLNVDQLIEKFKEFKEELNKDADCAFRNFSKDPETDATTGTSGGENSIYKKDLSKQSPAAQDMVAMSEDVKKDGGVNGVPPSGGSTVPGSISSQIGYPFGKEEKEVLKVDKNGQWSLDKSAFKTLQHKIEREGHSKESAGAITAAIGRKAIGEKAMEARSKAGMNKVDPDENVNIPHPKGKAKMANGVNKDEDMKDGTNQRIANPPEKDCYDGRAGRVHMVKDEGTNEEASPSRPHNKGKFKVMDEVKEKSSKKEKVAGKPYSDKGEIKKSDKLDCACKNPPCKCGNTENSAPGRHSGFGL